MKKLIKYIVSTVFSLLWVLTISFGQKVETTDGVLVIHNEKTGKWGKNPNVSLKFVKTIGKIDSEEDNLIFYIPSDIALDCGGNIYILDSGNHRIQKFDPDGKYISTIGNKGQGPGEFSFPLSLDIDSKGDLYVSDPGNQRIQILKSEGKDCKSLSMIKNSPGTIRISPSGHLIMCHGSSYFGFSISEMEENKKPPLLIKMLDLDGNTVRDFCTPLDYKDILMNRKGNNLHFAIDKNGNTYVAFDYQNRIEKYSPEGKILWKADRKLNYKLTSSEKKSAMKRTGGRIMIREPQMNRTSTGIDVDEKGRVWVVTLKRQIEDDERIQTSIRAMRGPGGEKSASISVSGSTDLINTDMYQLEVYNSDGILLGKFPLKHFVDDIRIKKDKLYLLDKMRGMQYYEYKIIEN